MKRSRAQSVVLSYGAILVSAVITLLFTPFLVSSLGIEGYGLISPAIALLLNLRVDMEVGRNWLETGCGILPLVLVVTALGLWAERYLPGGWNALLLGGFVHFAVFGLALYLLAASVDENAFIEKVLGRLRGGKT